MKKYPELAQPHCQNKIRSERLANTDKNKRNEKVDMRTATNAEHFISFATS